MLTIKVRNVHQALPEGFALLAKHGAQRETRNGFAFVIDEPVSTEYIYSHEKVILWPTRNANPFFHLFEAMWMLAGREDVKSLAQYLPKIAEFSDNGKVFHGAYGKRWRSHFGSMDQIEQIIENFKNDSTCRRQILQTWDARFDLNFLSKDIPCNTCISFHIAGGAINMSVFNRSNDMIWGTYGSDAVCFGFLLEYMAFSIGVTIGSYHQISTNYHVYDNKQYRRLKGLANEKKGVTPYSVQANPYYHGILQYIPLLQENENSEEFIVALNKFFEGSLKKSGFYFIDNILLPLHHCYLEYRHFSKIATSNMELVFRNIQITLNTVPECDWKTAAAMWFLKRKDKYESR